MEAVRHMFKPAKLLVCQVGRHRGEQLVKAAKAAGARGATIALGRSLTDNKIMQMLSLADVAEDVVFIVMGRETEAVLRAVEAAAAKEPKKLGGWALVFDVSGMLFRLAPEADENLYGVEQRSEKMESGYKLITVIVNHGYADDVMAAARKAGATGGTILNAHGTGTEDDVKFFGISLVPEKEMLMIVVDNEKVEAILTAVNEVPNIRQPGGGVVYNMNVEKFMPLGRP